MAENKPAEIRRSEIIHAAVSEFLEKGYIGTSMNSIAARAGLSKGGLYHHFAGKDEILLAANEEFSKPVYDLVMKAGSLDDPLEALTLYIREYLEHWSSHEKELAFTFLTMTRLIAHRKFWPQLEDYTAGMRTFFQSLFQRGIERCLLRPHDTAGRALTLMTALDGVTAYLVMDSSFSLETTMEHFLETFIREIRIS